MPCVFNFSQEKLLLIIILLVGVIVINLNGLNSAALVMRRVKSMVQSDIVRGLHALTNPSVLLHLPAIVYFFDTSCLWGLGVIPLFLEFLSHRGEVKYFSDLLLKLKVQPSISWKFFLNEIMNKVVKWEARWKLILSKLLV